MSTCGANAAERSCELLSHRLWPGGQDRTALSNKHQINTNLDFYSPRSLFFNQDLQSGVHVFVQSVLILNNSTFFKTYNEIMIKKYFVPFLKSWIIWEVPFTLS